MTNYLVLVLSELSAQWPIKKHHRERLLGNYLYGFFQNDKPIKESSSLLGACSWFSHDGVRAEVVAQFVKSRTEAGSRREVPEAIHGIIPLLDSPMVLFQAIIEIFVGSMKHTIAKRFAYCPWIGGVPIGANFSENEGTFAS